MEKAKEKLAKPLRMVDPKLYQYIVRELNDRHNIHSYDVKIVGVKEDGGIQMTIRYGENYTKSKETFLTCQVLKDFSEDLTKFIHMVADDCQKVMVADYFRMMKP